MIYLNNFIKNVSVETSNADIIELLFKPIKTNNNFFTKIVDILNLLKKLESQAGELEKKIKGLKKVDYMPENKTLQGMECRLFYVKRQIQKVDGKFWRIKPIMNRNFEMTGKMFGHLKEIGKLDQILLEISSDTDLKSTLKGFRFAWFEVYDKK